MPAISADVKANITYFQQLLTALASPMLVNVTNALNSVDVNASDADITARMRYLYRGPVRLALQTAAGSFPTPAVQVDTIAFS